MGLRYVHCLRHAAGEAIEREQGDRPFTDPDDLVRRCGLRREELETLAQIGALGSLGLSRRNALWQAGRAVRPAGSLFAGVARERSGAAGLPAASPLAEMSSYEETLADYAGTGMTTGRHPIGHLREELGRHRVLAAAELPTAVAGARVRTAGSVIVRQRPGTAKGMLFLTLEDETGMCQAIVSPDLMRRKRQVIVGSTGLVVEGVLQKRDGSLSVKAERFWRLGELVAAPSHDFR